MLRRRPIFAEASDQIILLLTISFTGSSRCSNMYQNRERYADIYVCIFHVTDLLCCGLFASIKACYLIFNLVQMTIFPRKFLFNCFTVFFLYDKQLYLSEQYCTGCTWGLSTHVVFIHMYTCYVIITGKYVRSETLVCILFHSYCVASVCRNDTVTSGGPSRCFSKTDEYW